VPGQGVLPRRVRSARTLGVMNTTSASPTPPLDPELARRIRLVRRDLGDLLFHFTRGDPPVIQEVGNVRLNVSTTAGNRLTSILRQGALRGSSTWTYGLDTVCFTEAPIQEFNAIFELNSIASENRLRPRYEPYGVAVTKAWLYSLGGRPVIYDSPTALEGFPRPLLYRFCPYDPTSGIDFTWEREWRVQTRLLQLEPAHTLVIVPTAAEAFEIVQMHANPSADLDATGSSMGTSYAPTWLAVSLDMFS
jgi:hypothetical protein